MIADPGLRRQRFAALARANGTFALLALDQRESLRAMLAEAGQPSDDPHLRGFKVTATRMLSPLASGVLLDPAHGVDAVLDAHALAPGCGLVVAADELVQPRGAPIRATTFDTTLDLAAVARRGAVALKLLVLLRPAADPAPATAMVRAFVAASAAAGLVSLVEAVVRDDDPWEPERHAAAVTAAAEVLGSTGPDLYKAEVPTLGRGSREEIEAAAAEVTASLPCPWVVLSNGTSPDAFPEALRAVCRGGASGFLAGRAVWAPSIAAATGPADLERRLATDASARLRALVEIVDGNARPWMAAA